MGDHKNEALTKNIEERYHGFQPMQLVEFDGKNLLSGLNISIPNGKFVTVDQTTNLEGLPPGPWFIKAQVLQGSRGKRGWIKLITTHDELLPTLQGLCTAIDSEPCAGFLLESATPHQSEWLLSIDIDRATGKRRIHLAKEGGQEVAALQTYIIEKEQDWRMIIAPAEIITVARKLYDGMTQHDILTVEINPLAILEDGSCIALDAKIELDDAASVRHPEWKGFCTLSRHGRVRSERETAFMQLVADGSTLGRYVELDGDVAMILSGGGASLVAMDALTTAGGKPANYLEMSGNPDPNYVRQAAHIAFSHPHLHGVWIAGSFANFTDIQTTVMAALSALEEKGLRIPVVIRRDGPRAAEAEQEARAWADRLSIPLCFHRADTDLDTSAKELLALMS